MRRWSQRFLSSTRGRVVQLLRRGAATVNDLAAALELTDNAVRAHLDTLARDGLVRAAGKRPGLRKPERLYALTPEAEQLFPRAYHLLLSQLLGVLGEYLSPAEVDDLLREVGRRLAEGHPSPSDDRPLRERAEHAVGLLSAMGGLAELQQEEHELVIRGYSCPIAAAAREHPDVCRVAEALLSEVIGVPVREACEHEETPRCVFRIAAGS